MVACWLPGNTQFHETVSLSASYLETSNAAEPSSLDYQLPGNTHLHGAKLETRWGYNCLLAI